MLTFWFWEINAKVRIFVRKNLLYSLVSVMIATEIETRWGRT
jgi:hypothetical protein